MASRRALGPASAALALLACVVVVWPAQAADPRKGTRYAGKTSQGYKISFRTSRDGTHLRKLRVTLLVYCRRNTLFSLRKARFRQTTPFIDVRKSGRFGGRVKIAGDAVYEIRSGRVKVSGRFTSKRRGRGTVLETLKLSEDIRCTSGDVSFKVRAKPPS
jgi:hypothetical protein